MRCLNIKYDEYGIVALVNHLDALVESMVQRKLNVKDGKQGIGSHWTQRKDENSY